MTDISGTTVRVYDGLNRNTSKIVPGIGESIYPRLYYECKNV